MGPDYRSTATEAHSPAELIAALGVAGEQLGLEDPRLFHIAAEDVRGAALARARGAVPIRTDNEPIAVEIDAATELRPSGERLGSELHFENPRHELPAVDVDGARRGALVVVLGGADHREIAVDVD